MQIAKTIIAQMGGAGRLSRMINAQNFLATDNGVQFKFMRGAANKANRCAVELDADDTYTFKLSRVHGLKVTDIYKVSGVYFDQLVTLFEGQTKLALHL